MGKKKLDVMAKEREIFIHGQVDENGNVIVPGCVRNGIDEESANKIFDEMAEFAKYAFNKSHAACYAVVAYRTAYLKAYYPAEFMAATLNSFLGNLDKIPQYIDECKTLGIQILKPDINKSNTKFTVERDEVIQVEIASDNNDSNNSNSSNKNGNVNVNGVNVKTGKEVIAEPEKVIKPQEGSMNNDNSNNSDNKNNKVANNQIGKIRFGLGSIKNVGTVPVNNIVKQRNENGPYKSFTDFCERIAEEGVNKKCIESLIKAGVFDEFEQTRSTLLASFESIIDTIQSGKKKGFKGQVSMFDLGTEEEKEELNEIKYTFEEHEELQNKELLSLEKEMLGIYISGHPLEKLRSQIEAQTTINTIELRNIDEQMNSNIDEEGSNLMNANTKLKYKDGQNVKYAGIISSIKKKYTKNNKIMAFVTIEDLYGTAEIIVFENAYLKSGKSLVEENIVMVDGRLSIREDDTTTIIANDIKDFGENKIQILTLDITNTNEEEKDKLRGAIKFFNGDKNNINVQIKIGEELKPCGQVYLTEDILKVFEEIIGKDNVSILTI